MSSKAKSISWDCHFKNEMDVCLVVLIPKWCFSNKKRRIFLIPDPHDYRKNLSFLRKCEYGRLRRIPSCTQPMPWGRKPDCRQLCTIVATTTPTSPSLPLCVSAGVCSVTEAAGGGAGGATWCSQISVQTGSMWFGNFLVNDKWLWSRF